MNDNAIATLNQFNHMAQSAMELLESRNEVKPKLPRTFTRTEAKNYLGIDSRTIDRYAKQLGIDPMQFKESAGLDWTLTLDEIYQIRDILPETTLLKKRSKKFKRQPGQRCQRIVIQNQKGGVGKTITSVTLATGIAIQYHEGYRVCMVDMDGQSTLSSYQPSIDDEPRKTIGDLIQLDPLARDFQEQVQNAVSDTTIPNLKILPASQVDRDIEAIFHEGVFTQTITDPYLRLSHVLDALEDLFDVIIIDTPPSLGYASINAYYAATSVVFPLGANQNDTDATCQYFSYLPQIYKTLIKLEHPGYDFIRMLLTNYDGSRSNIEVKSDLMLGFNEFLYSTEFKSSEAVRICSLQRNSVFEMSPSGYDGPKRTFNNAELNARSVVQDILNDILVVWKKQYAEFAKRGDQ